MRIQIIFKNDEQIEYWREESENYTWYIRERSGIEHKSMYEHQNAVRIIDIYTGYHDVKKIRIIDEN